MGGEVEVVLANRREYVDVEDDLVADDASDVGNARRYVEELTRADGVPVAVEVELQRAGEDQRELVVRVAVGRNLRVARLDPVERDDRVVGANRGTRQHAAAIDSRGISAIFAWNGAAGISQPACGRSIGAVSGA